MIVFDLDGTLADCEHRRPLIAGTERSPQWEEFFRQCVLDKPIWPTIAIFKALRRVGEHIEIWSGRSESVRAETEAWLARFVFEPSLARPRLRMRPAGDTTPDDVLKERWLIASRPRPMFVFDDRQKVVDMWRRHGVMCAQVAPGDF